MMHGVWRRIDPWMAALAGVALVTRLLIVGWTMPYPANPAHEHPFFYDSGMVIHDQYKVLRALSNFPQGLVVEAAEAAWPVLQRYIAAVPLGLWFAFDYGFSPVAVMAAPYVETAYKTLLINRLVSVGASVAAIALLGSLLRRFFPQTISLFLAAVFTLTVSEIGLAIHAKTVSLVTVMYLVEALLLERWARNRGRDFKYLWWAFFAVGLATAAREYGLLFGGLLAGLVMVFVLGKSIFKLPGLRPATPGLRRARPATSYGLLILAVLAGIALGSPDIFAEVPYWAAAVLEPGGRAWHSTSLATVPLELWALSKLLFGGSLGTGLFMASVGFSVVTWRRQQAFTRAIIVWIVLYMIIFALYPLKDPRFVAGMIPFAFLLIGLLIAQWPGGSTSKVVILGLWFIQALAWGTSAWVFFNGADVRLRAAEEFNAAQEAGVSVAEFFPPYHTLHIPVDDQKFIHYQYDDLHSAYPELLFIESGHAEQMPKDSRGEFIGEAGIWPEYAVIDYETDAYTYPSDQVSKHKFRSSILASGRYELNKIYPKRTGFGLFATRSRWVYLNPVVEIYRLRP